jgi:DNA ligase-1
LSHKEYEGLDGELICGDPTDKACYRNTVSGVMSHDGTPQFRFFVFDFAGSGEYLTRFGYAVGLIEGSMNDKFVIVDQEELDDEAEVLAYEEKTLWHGHEGVILRAPRGLYKLGRSTTNEGWLLKLKRFHDSEAVIIGMEEEERNDNELTTDERGYAHRTSHMANKSGKGRMGALLVRDLVTGIESKIGTGFSAAERDEFWTRKMAYVGLVVKYKYFAIGVKDKPRHPVFLGMRPDGA